MRIDIPVQPFPMLFYAAVLFCASGRLCAGGQTGSCLCVRLPGSGIGGDSRICSRRRAGVSDPSYLWFFDRLCGCGLDYRKAVLEASGGRVAWRLFSAFWGMMAYYLCGMVYFYVISNYVIHMPVSWKLVVINCFLITAAEDFILCVMAAVVARRLMPFALGQYR